MNEAQLYIDFVEGNLDDDALKEFTKMLAIDREFLTGFQSFLLVTQTMSLQAAQIRPPADFTENLFEKLGFTLNPDAEVEIAEKFVEDEKKSFLDGKYFKGLISGVLLTAVFFTGYLFSHFSDENESQQANNPVKTRLFENNYESKPAIPEVKSYADESLNNNKENKNNIIHKRKISRQAQDTYTSEPAASETESLAAAVELTKPHSVDFSHNELSGINDKAYGLTVPAFGDIFEPNQYKKDLNVSIELNNSAVWNIPEPRLPYNTVSPINNLCLSVFYHIDSEVKAGVEIRQESYYLEYFGTEPDSILYKYAQHSNFTTLGLKAAYQPFEIFDIMPTVQVGLGANRGGIALRPYLGIEYHPYHNMSFTLGAEYTKYWFVHQSQWNSTSKIGVNYGLIYKF